MGIRHLREQDHKRDTRASLTTIIITFLGNNVHEKKANEIFTEHHILLDPRN